MIGLIPFAFVQSEKIRFVIFVVSFINRSSLWVAGTCLVPVGNVGSYSLKLVKPNFDAGKIVVVLCSRFHGNGFGILILDNPRTGHYNDLNRVRMSKDETMNANA